MLELVAINHPEDLELHRIKKEDYYARCPRKRCHHKWKTTVGAIVEDGHCPACGGKV